MWRSLVAHCFREAGVGGSNPLIPTWGKALRRLLFTPIPTSKKQKSAQILLTCEYSDRKGYSKGLATRASRGA